jgi:hypothetical protein
MELGLRTQIASALKEEKWIFYFYRKHRWTNHH